MRPLVKNVALYLLAIILGMVIGVPVTMSWLGFNLQDQVQMVKLFHITYEIEEANTSYYGNNPPFAKMQSLEHAIKFLEQVCNANTEADCEKATFFDMATLYVRLGMLYETTGKLEMASSAFANAFKLAHEKSLFEKWKSTEKEIKTIEDLKKYVKEQEKRLQK